MREVVLDTETTGLEPENGDRVIEIGCVELVNRKPTGNTFRELLNPEKLLTAEITRITGYTDKDLKDKPLFKDVVDRFLGFIGNDILVAHNANFDIKFINSELKMLDIPPLLNIVVDSIEIARVKLPGKKYNLDALCRHFNIDLTERETNGHGALLDSQLLAEVYLRLREGEQGDFFVNNNDEKIDFKEYKDGLKNNKTLTARSFLPTQDEIEKHKFFIEKNVKESIWSKNEKIWI
jgi:DNA polymerase-3 subunit epsilon